MKSHEPGIDGRSAGRATPLPYLPGLDGLRALSVIAVLLYHADVTWMRGGFLGVDVFFVISGYLITSLLLAEWRQRGRLDLRAFWLRRARRLLPALFLLLVLTLAFVELFLSDEVAGLRAAVVAAATYVTNWYLVLDHKSYFETIGRPPLLRHLWSLAIEEQFYLLWPLLFIAGMKFCRRRYLLLATLIGALASTVLMAVLYQPDADPSRLYYGTDTRATGLLIGAALALVGAPGPSGAPSRRWFLLDLIGLAALGALVLFFVQLDEFQPFLYQGGYAVVAFTAAILIAVVVHPRSRLGAGLLGRQPLRWIGLRSYGIYLWHWPVYMLTRPQLDVPVQGWPLLALRLAITALLVHLSYRYVETPIRGGALGRAWQALGEARGGWRWRLGLQWAATAGTVVAVAMAATFAQPAGMPAYLALGSISGAASAAGTEPVAMVSDPASSEQPSPAADAAAMSSQDNPALVSADPAQNPTTGVLAAAPAPGAVTNDKANLRQGPGTGYGILKELTAGVPLRVLGKAPSGDWLAVRMSDGMEGWVFANLLDIAGGTADLPLATTPAAAQPARSESSKPLPPSAGTAQSQSQPAAAPARAPAPSPSLAVTAVGDSVMLGAAGALGQAVSGISVDAAVGRQAAAAIAILRERRDSGQLGAVVVVHIGNNGPISARQFDELMQVLSGVRRVVIVNLKVPREWEAPNNAVLAAGARRYPNAVLVDWHGASAGQPELFWGDGIHLRPEGARLYANLVANASAP